LNTARLSVGAIAAQPEQAAHENSHTKIAKRLGICLSAPAEREDLLIEPFGGFQMISFRTLLAAVAVVGLAAFAVGRESRPSFAISPFTICSAATEAAYPAETPYLTENDTAMNKMMADMVIKPTGDVDRDFVSLMTPHHQGAIEMAQAVLRNGSNEQVRRLAQEIIVTQQQEIAAMRLAIGDPLPPSLPSPTQVSVSSGSFSPVLSFPESSRKAGELQ